MRFLSSGRRSTDGWHTGRDFIIAASSGGRRRLLLLLLAALFIVWPVLAGPPQLSGDIDVLHYRIAMEIPSSGQRISARTELLLAFRMDAVKQVSLDFSGMEIDEVSEEGSPARFTRSADRLTISLRGEYSAGDRCHLAIAYHGEPSDGLYIKKNKFGDRTIFGDDWPNRAHYWFPCSDSPDDKATAEFLVTAPVQYQVVANGKLAETANLQDGRTMTHWSEETPIPAYCMVVGVAEFSIIHAGSYQGTPLDYYLYPKDRGRGLKDYGRALQMLEFYSNLIGPYPYEKLALVESSTRFGGMENASSIFFDEKAYDGSGRLEGTVAHEIAHQWFGDSVTEKEWSHLWLSEGFATYFGHLFFERADGRDRFLQLLREDKERYLKSASDVATSVIDPAITDLFSLLNASNYQKGGWVLHMLRHVMGDAKFFAGIRDYYRTYSGRNALTADFQHVMEFHAGRPLDWFFQEWLYQPGYPLFGATWHWDEANKEIHLQVLQKQPDTVFRMPIDIQLTTGDKSRRETIQVNERDQSFTFKASSKPQSLSIDPDEWVLKVLTLREQ